MILSIKEAKEILIDEFRHYHHVYENPLGNAGADRKIRNLIFACIRENVSKSACTETMNSVLSLFPIGERAQEEIHCLIEVYYAAKELLDSGYYTFR